jgi:3-oxoacyl-[acyl-carrier-protein] synthase III
MDVVAVATALLSRVFDEVERRAPRMDFADGCAVVLVRSHERAFVLTTDFRDFSTKPHGCGDPVSELRNKWSASAARNVVDLALAALELRAVSAGRRACSRKRGTKVERAA